MNYNEITSMVRERYYTVGKQYFKERCPAKKLPNLNISNITFVDSTFDKSATIDYVYEYDEDKKFVSIIIDAITVYPNDIANIISSKLCHRNVRKSMYYIIIDFMLLRSIEKAVNIYTRCRFKPHRYSENEIDRMLEDIIGQGSVVEEEIAITVLSYLANNRESNLERMCISLLYSELLDKNNLESQINIKNDIRDKCLNEPYTLSVLNSINHNLTEKVDFEILNDGVYINKKTNRVLLKPNI